MKSVRILAGLFTLLLVMPLAALAENEQQSMQWQFYENALNIENLNRFLKNRSLVHIPFGLVIGFEMEADQVGWLLMEWARKNNWDEAAATAYFNQILRMNVDIRRQMQAERSRLEREQEQILDRVATLRRPPGPSSGPLSGYMQGELDATRLREVLARHRSPAMDFQCDKVEVQFYPDGTVELAGAFQCTLTATSSKPSGITWSRNTYSINFTPLGRASQDRLQVRQVIEVRWEYVENNRRHEKLSTRTPRELTVSFRQDGVDRLMILANGIAGVFNDVPWRLKRYIPARSSGSYLIRPELSAKQ